MSLSSRQWQLLKTIIEEYIDTGIPAGSVGLVSKYRLDFSPATTRNEMNFLMQQGFLEQPHTSAGRVPAALGYRLYLDRMLEDIDVPVLQEVAIKQNLWQYKNNPMMALRAVALSLAEYGQGLSVITCSPNQVYTAGSANILDYEEFFDIDVTRSILNLVDHYDLLVDLFGKIKNRDDVGVLIGTEFGLPNFEKCALAIIPYRAGSYRGHLAVLGPCRLRYRVVLPLLRYVKGLIEDLGNLW